MSQVAHDMWRGARYGGAFGAALSIWAALVYLIGGRTAFAEKGVSLAGLVALYLLNGVAGGVLVGLVRPLTRSLPGMILTAMLVAVPVAVAIRLMASGLEPLTRVDLEGMAIIIVCGGAAGGVGVWRALWHDELKRGGGLPEGQ